MTSNLGAQRKFTALGMAAGAAAAISWMGMLGCLALPVTAGLCAGAVTLLFRGGDLREDEELARVSNQRIRTWGVALALAGVSLLSPCLWMGELSLELYDRGGLLNPTMLGLTALTLGVASGAMIVVGARAVMSPTWLRTQRQPSVGVRQTR